MILTKGVVARPVSVLKPGDMVFALTGGAVPTFVPVHRLENRGASVVVFFNEFFKEEFGTSAMVLAIDRIENATDNV